ncbi:hypothetical protein D3C76_406390 [compost metagenome]
MVANARPDNLRQFLGRAIMHLTGIQYLKAHDVVIGRALANLDGARRINQPFADGVIEHRAVVDALVLAVGLQVMVRIEMDQGQRTILGRVSLQQRIADEVIAAQGQHRSTCRQDPLGMGPDRRRGLLRGAVIEIAIAIIDTSQQIERVKFPRPVTRPGRLDRCLADGPRSEAAARSIAGRGIEWDAADGDIHAT